MIKPNNRKRINIKWVIFSYSTFASTNMSLYPISPHIIVQVLITEPYIWLCSSWNKNIFAVLDLHVSDGPHISRTLILLLPFGPTFSRKHRNEHLRFNIYAKLVEWIYMGYQNKYLEGLTFLLTLYMFTLVFGIVEINLSLSLYNIRVTKCVDLFQRKALY